MSRRKRRKNKMSSRNTAKRRHFQFNKENKVPEDQNEVESEEESPERPISNINCVEVESTQNYSMEENYQVLQERQKNRNDNKSGTGNERGLVAKSTSEKSVMVPEHSDLRAESETLHCQMIESSEDGDSNGK